MKTQQLERFPNLVSMFLARAAVKGGKPFLWAKRGAAWQATSWREAARQVAALAEMHRRGPRLADVDPLRPASRREDGLPADRPGLS